MNDDPELDISEVRRREVAAEFRVAWARLGDADYAASVVAEQYSLTPEQVMMIAGQFPASR